MLGISLNPIDWVKDAVGWAADETSSAILDAITAWVEEGLRSLAQSVAMMVIDLGAQGTGLYLVQVRGNAYVFQERLILQR